MVLPAAGQGIDAGKKIAGRKRHIGVDTLGLLLAVCVTAASVSDNVGGIRLMHHRRLARDHETHPHRSEAMIHVAMIDLMSRRLTGEPTPNWRDT